MKKQDKTECDIPSRSVYYTSGIAAMPDCCDVYHFSRKFKQCSCPRRYIPKRDHLKIQKSFCTNETTEYSLKSTR